MAKPKRLKPKEHVEAESDAHDLVCKVLSVVLDQYKPKLDHHKNHAIMLGRDPNTALRAAILRGARRALNAEGKRKWIPFAEALKRSPEGLPYLDPPRNPQALLDALRGDPELIKKWAIKRMETLINPPPLHEDGDPKPSTYSVKVRPASYSVAAELGGLVKADQIRSWWRYRNKR